VAQVKAVACTPPADCGVPLSRWSCPELARHAAATGICASIASASRTGTPSTAKTGDWSPNQNEFLW